MSGPVVTVDGPAGSGKSTLGIRLARALALPLIDTGLFYRAVMVAAQRAGVSTAQSGGETALAELAQGTRIELWTAPEHAPWRLRVDGSVADAEAYDPKAAGLLAEISRLGGVRDALLAPQRALAAEGAVAVGRDCGTVVFPHAQVKLFLDAATEVRSRRRAAQLAKRGARVDDDTLHTEIARRDQSDRDRPQAPLRAAADAHHIDTGRYAIEDMVATALGYCRAAGLATKPAL